MFEIVFDGERDVLLGCEVARVLNWKRSATVLEFMLQGCEDMPFSPWLSRSHDGVNVHGSKTSSNPSITKGFPPMMTCNRTNFSNCSMPLLAIISYEIRSTYWKFSADSTNVRTSKSGGMGSNEALGRAAGIFIDSSAFSKSCVQAGLETSLCSFVAVA